MIEIKEQSYQLGLCVQRVKKTVGILYPDVSTCLTFTGVLDNDFIGAHLSLGSDIKGPVDHNFIKKRLDSLSGEAKDLQHCYIIGWYGQWGDIPAADKKQKEYVEVLRAKLKVGYNLWLGSLDVLKQVKYKKAHSSNVMFLPNGKISIEMKGEKSKILGTQTESWTDPKAADNYWFAEID